MNTRHHQCDSLLLEFDRIRRRLDPDAPPDAGETESRVLQTRRAASGQAPDRLAGLGLSDLEIDILVSAASFAADVAARGLFDRNATALTIDTVCQILGLSTAAIPELLRVLSASAALRRLGLIELDSGEPDSFLQTTIRIDARVLRWLFGQPGIDDRLLDCVRVLEPDATEIRAALTTERQRAIVDRLSATLCDGDVARVIHLVGPAGNGRRTTARLVCRAVGLRLLEFMPALSAVSLSPFTLLNLALRECWLEPSALLIDADAIDQQADFARLSALMRRRLRGHAIPVFFVSTRTLHWQASGEWNVLDYSLPLPNSAARRQLWEAALTDLPIARKSQVDAGLLATQFHFSVGQILGAVAHARPDINKSNNISQFDISRACYLECSHDLEELARPVRTPYRLPDLVLGEKPGACVKELIDRIRFTQQVVENWGGAGTVNPGLCVLFHGRPGTGKTMAASVVANELNMKVYRIDLATVVDKYIGETEKNLARIFAAARSSGAILFFDEADALFGKRSEVKDARDRYANIEVSYLLQQMEEFEGVTILATNIRQNLDQAFLRRFEFLIEFPMPGAYERRRLWELAFPDRSLLSPELSLAALAETLDITGAGIKNIANAARFLAAADGASAIDNAHIRRAAYRELEKEGRNMPGVAAFGSSRAPNSAPAAPISVTRPG